MKKRLLLILNGIVAVRTEPLWPEERDIRTANWERVFGPQADIREEAA